MQPSSHKKFSEELAAQAMVALTKITNLEKFVADTKAADEEDTGTFEVIASTAAVDRHGEIVSQDGWDIENYLKNPIILWGHDYWSLPIGIATGVKVENDQLIITGKFASAEANPFAQQVRRLYDEKIVRATSVGFINRKYEYDEDQDQVTLVENELLELSFVPVPANPEAVSLRQLKELGLNTDMLAMKGLAFKTEEAKEKVEDEPADEPAPEGGDKPAGEDSEKDGESTEIKAASDARQQVGMVMTTMQSTIDTAVTEASRTIMEILENVEDEDDEKNMAKRVEESVEKITAAAAAMKTALEKSTSADPPEESGTEATGGDEGEDEGEGSDPDTRSVNTEGGEEGFDDFQSSRHLLRSCYTAIGGALESMNKRQRGTAE